MIDIKIDTKEKFTVITPLQDVLSANMTDEMNKKLQTYMNTSLPHLIVNMQNVVSIDVEVAEGLATLQQSFYENNCSFVICCLSKNVQALLTELDLFDVMNITPTESEAWDIVQMEEIERELLG